MALLRESRTAGLGLLLVLTVPITLAAQGPVLSIPKADCARLVRHAPVPDVTYQPGVDVRGGQVVPADLDSDVVTVNPDNFLIPIEVDLVDRLGIPADPDRLEADILIGVVEVREGRAYFNGQPLDSEDEAALSAICREAAREP